MLAHGCLVKYGLVICFCGWRGVILAGRGLLDISRIIPRIDLESQFFVCCIPLCREWRDLRMVEGRGRFCSRLRFHPHRGQGWSPICCHYRSLHSIGATNWGILRGSEMKNSRLRFEFGNWEWVGINLLSIFSWVDRWF